MTDELIRVAICIIEHHEHFLVGQRPPGSKLAGFWEFPGGKIELGESPRQCAIREAQEETGLKVKVTRLLCQQHHCYDYSQVELHFWACALAAANLGRKASETFPVARGDFRWVNRRRLSELAFPEANARVLSMLCH